MTLNKSLIKFCITFEKVWGHIKRPIGVLIGMLSQFILLPFAAFCLIIVLDFDPLHSAGMIVLACSPGGVTSNIFTYFCDGDLSLRLKIWKWLNANQILFAVWLWHLFQH